MPTWRSRATSALSRVSEKTLATACFEPFAAALIVSHHCRTGWTRHCCGVKGECAGYIQEIAPDEIAGYVRYALKLPLCQYNVKADNDHYDPETGDILRAVKVSTNPLRPVDQLRLSALLSDMCLDHLIFGQHEGTAIAREIRRRARLPLKRRNEIPKRERRPPSKRLATEEISRWKRTPVAKLIQNPPKRVWLGPRLSIERIEPFLRGYTAGAGAIGGSPRLSELVLN